MVFAVNKAEKFDEYYIVGGGYNDLEKFVCGGKVGVAKMLSKLIDWHNWKKGDWFYLSDQDCANDIARDERSVREYRKFLKSNGFIIVETRMVNGRKLLHYKVIIPLIKELIAKGRRPKTSDAVNKYLRKTHATTGSPFPMSPEAHFLCHRKPISGSTLSYNTSNNTTSYSSLEVTPVAEAPVVGHHEEEEEIKNHFEKEQPEGTPVQVVETPVKQQEQQLPQRVSNANAIKPVDMKVISERMTEIWNEVCHVAKSDPKNFIFSLTARFRDSFNGSLDEWREYCRKIASSKFLMGERPMHNGSFYKLSLTWALSPKNIADVRNGKYDSDREIPKTEQDIIAEKESTIDKIHNSNEDPWAINLRKALLDKLGDSIYKDWFSDLKINEKEGKLFFVTPRAFKVDLIKQRYSDDIKSVLDAQGITESVCICDNAEFVKIISFQQKDTINANSNQGDISEAVQSLAESMRLHKIPGKPEPIENSPDISGQYTYHTQPSIRNAMLKAAEKIANRA